MLTRLEVSEGPCFDSGRQPVLPQAPGRLTFPVIGPKHCVGFPPRAVLIRLIRHPGLSMDTILHLYLRI